jgi:signal transduction histidine kinase
MYSVNELPLPVRWIFHPWRVATLILGLTFFIEVALMIILPILTGNSLGKWGMAALDAFLLTILLAPCIWGLMVRPLKRVADTRKQLLAWAMSTEERKAGEISRDLHDNFGQLLTSITIGLRTIEEISHEPAVIEHAKRIRQTGLELHESIRSTARGLRPTVLDDLGLAAALANLAQDWRQSSSVNVELEVDDLKSLRLSADVETALYRIAQESMVNAIRHGAPKRVSIAGRIVNQRLHLIITDDGCGFDASQVLSPRAAHRPFGLISIRERADAVGGLLKLTSTVGKGVKVEVILDIGKATLPRTSSKSLTYSR